MQLCPCWTVPRGISRPAGVGLVRALVLALVLGFPCAAGATAELLILEPEELVTTTTREQIRVVGTTDPGAVTTATVAGTSVPVSRSGRFVREEVPLRPGRNEILVTVTTPDGTRRNERRVEVNRVAE